MSESLFWLSAGGGAGTTTIRTCVGFGVEVPSLRVSTGLAVVVCRSTAKSLMRAQRIAVANAENGLLAGLVINADAPGKLPKPLEDLARLVSGAAVNVWRVPWHPPWRFGEPCELRTAPRVVRRLAEELQFAIDHRNPPAACPVPVDVAHQLANSVSFNDQINIERA